jgi:hypothetical protein
MYTQNPICGSNIVKELTITQDFRAPFRAVMFRKCELVQRPYVIK